MLIVTTAIQKSRASVFAQNNIQHTTTLPAQLRAAHCLASGRPHRHLRRFHHFAYHRRRHRRRCSRQCNGSSPDLFGLSPTPRSPPASHHTPPLRTLASPRPGSWPQPHAHRGAPPSRSPQKSFPPVPAPNGGELSEQKLASLRFAGRFLPRPTPARPSTNLHPCVLFLLFVFGPSLPFPCSAAASSPGRPGSTPSQAKTAGTFLGALLVHRGGYLLLCDPEVRAPLPLSVYPLAKRESMTGEFQYGF